jgi:hypothetical protein
MMAGQERIVLFNWVPVLGGQQQESAPLGRSRRTGLSHGGKDPAASRRAGAGLVGWRVIGENNRELGRGAGPFWQVDEAYQAADDAQAVLEQTVTCFWADDLRGWFWNVSLEGEQLAVSGRGYRQQRECSYSVKQFRERFPTAKRLARTF